MARKNSGGEYLVKVETTRTETWTVIADSAEQANDPFGEGVSIVDESQDELIDWNVLSVRENA